jgi:AcrR family transcriptional regulator
MATASSEKTARQRVPAAERRDALIEAAVHEFAHGGLHGTPVGRIADRVGVAQPYVFSLFANKRELFLAAVERGFRLVEETFTAAAEAYEPAQDTEGAGVLMAMGQAYVGLLQNDRDFLMMQHHAYAACDDPVIQEQVRAWFAHLVGHIQELSGETVEGVDEFIRHGMALNVAAAMGVEDLSAGCEWLTKSLAGANVPSAPVNPVKHR